MHSLQYLNTVFATHKLGELHSDVSFPNFPDPIMGEVVFHNMQLLKPTWGVKS